MSRAHNAYPCLSEAGPECIFILPDDSSDMELEIECSVEQEARGISIKAGDIPNGDGRPVFIEWRNHELCVHIWADESREDPTHSIKIPLEY